MALDQQYRKMLRDLMLQSDSLAGQQTLPDGSIIGYGANNPDAMVAAVAPPPPPQVNQQPQTPQQLSALLVNQRPQGFNDQQRFDEAYQFKQSMPEKQSYLRNNTTGAVQMLPSFVRQPAMQQQPQEPSLKQIIDDLMYYAKGKSIPSDQLGKMIQYQATKAQGAPSAQDLYHEASGRGIPIETLISAYLTIGGANTAREKENLALQKQRAEIAKREAEVRKMNAPGNTPEQYAEIERQKALGKMRGEMEGMGGGNGSGQPPAGGTGDLAGVSDDIKNQVVALAEGRMAFPSGFALKSPYWQKMLQLVSEYDPNFDAINYNARAKTRADFTSGKSAENIKSLNTAIGHLSTLTEKFNKLENSRFPSWNTMANWTGSKSGNEKIQSAVGGFDTAKLAVSGEMAKVFRSVGMSRQEIDHWMDRLSSSQSPADFKSTMETATDLMGGRLDAIGDQYTKGMGKSTQGLDLLSPDAKKQFQKIQDGGKSAGATSTSVTLPNGKVKVFPSGAAAQAFRMETGLQ